MNATMTREDERAREAVKRFRKMLPTLNSYVRAVTGNPKLRIQITKDNGSSTRNAIYFQPPIKLGDKLRHDSYLCERRDENNILLCMACRTDENIMALIYHEIGHIAFGTHDLPPNASLRKFSDAFGVDHYLFMDKYNKIANQLAEKSSQHSFMSTASVMDSYLPKLYNATEDARVNQQIFDARRGVKVMYESLMADIIENGVPIPGTEEVKQWRDMAANHQICLAVYMHLAGYDYADWFQAEIVESLTEPNVQRVLDKFDLHVTAEQNLLFTIDLFKELQAIGYFSVEPKEKDSGSEQGESDGAGDDSGDDDDGEGGSSEASDSDTSEGSESGSPSGSPEGSSDGGSSGTSDDGNESTGDSSDPVEDGEFSSDDESSNEGELPDTGEDLGEGGVPIHGSEDAERYGHKPDEGEICIIDMTDLHKAMVEEEDSTSKTQARKLDGALQKAIIQSIYFETPAVGVHGVEIIRPGDENYEAYGTRRHVREMENTLSQGELNNAVLHARVVFEANKRAVNQRNLKKGKINGRSLSKRAPFNDERMFQKRIIPGKRDYYVAIGMDISYSTVGANLQMEKEAVANQAELLSRLGVPFSIHAHSSGRTDYGSGGTNLLVWEVKTVNQPWDTKAKENLDALQAVSGNLDGHFMEFLRKQTDTVTATDKIILYYSDGKMPAENHDEELEILQREIKHCRQTGIHLMGVGIRTDSPSRHGLETVQINHPGEVKVVIDQLKKKLLV